MRSLQILVEAVSLGNELLLPLSETLLFDLDLLGEPLAKRLLLFLELGVVQLPGAGFTKFPGLHLLRTVGLVVLLLGGVDKIQHVGTNQDRTKLLKVAVVLILNFGNAPGILTTLYDPVVASLHVLLRTDHGERHGSHQAPRVGGSVLIIFFNRGSVDFNALGFNDSFNLYKSIRLSKKKLTNGEPKLILLSACSEPDRRG